MALTDSVLRELYRGNQEEFEQSRIELGIVCRDEIRRQTAVLFNKTEQVECEMVDSYVTKLKQCIGAMNALDLEETDELGNFINTSKVFTLIELSTRLQSVIAKIVGTDALREIEVFRQKAEAKRDSESRTLLPPPSKTSTTTIFV